MADLIIRGMEMPATCWNCKLKVGFSACGLVTDHKDGGLFYRVHNGNSRPDWCPLVHLPKGHGRIVDAAEILEKANKAPWFDGDVSELGLLLGSEVTTIVPAEGGTDDGN